MQAMVLTGFHVQKMDNPGHTLKQLQYYRLMQCILILLYHNNGRHFYCFVQ